MRRLTTILIFLLMIGSVMAQFSMTPGRKMPTVDATPLTAVKRPHIGKDSKIMDVIVFSDINSQDFLQTLRYIESLESKFERSNTGNWIFKFKVIVPNTKADAERFLKVSEIPITVQLMVDNNGRTFRNFVVTKISDAIIGIDGAIAWTGPAMDLDNVINLIMENKFSMEDYRKISRMKMEMQTALRSGLPDVAAKTAEKILEKIPGDILSIQTILYSYEVKQQSGKAILFLNSCIAKNGKKAGGIRLMLLDRIIRSGDFTLWQKSVDEAIKNTVSPDDKLNLAAFLVDMSPRFHFPAEQVPLLCADILKQTTAAKDPEFYANALEIAARAEFAVCRLNHAIQYQEQALALRIKHKSPYLKRCQQALNYYKRIQKLPAKK